MLVNNGRIYQLGEAELLARERRIAVTQSLILGPAVVETVFQLQPEIIVIGIPVVTNAHLTILERIRQRCPWTFVVATVLANDDSESPLAPGNRADLVLHYESVWTDLLPTMEQVIRILESQLAGDSVRRSISALTNTQRAVAALLSTGASNTVIAEALTIEVLTARNHVQAIRERFGGMRRDELIAALACRRRTLVNPPADAAPIALDPEGHRFIPWATELASNGH